jgi:ABC-type uncharacterized transport system involved in gliding motility auxiliary subunit
MKNYARFFGIIGIILFVCGGIASVVISGKGRAVAIAEFVLGFVGMIFFLFYFLKETLSKISEKKETIYGIFGVVFSLLLLIAANVITHTKWGERKFDTTTNKIHSLSADSSKLLKNLTSDIEIIGFFEKESRDGALLEDLAKKYTYESSKISLQIADPDKDPALVKEYNGAAQEVVVRNKQTKKQYKLTAVTEEALTSTIKRVMSSETKTIYFLQGHGEGELESDKAQGLYIAKVLLENEGYTVKTLNLATSTEIPKDAHIISAWGAARSISKSEVDTLTNYVERGGSLIIGQGPLISATDTSVDPTGFEPLLEKFGLRFKPSVLLEYQIQLLQGKVINATLPVSDFSKHAIVAGLGNQAVMEVRLAQPVLQDPNFKDTKITRTALASTSENSWAETNIKSVLKDQKPEPQISENGDQKGPLPIGQISEIPVATNSKDALSTKGKVVVFGDAYFGSNKGIKSALNRDVFLNAFNYVSGDAVSLSIRPKTWSQSTLQVSPAIADAVNFAGAALLPQLILMIAAIVWITRRSRV